MENDVSNGVEIYKFAPLDTSKPSIRLLEILPQRQDGCIALSLTHVDLNDFANQFHTLSYTWGSKHPIFQIFIDGKPVRIRKNIYLFLLHCYEIAVIKIRWLWVDSICINQEDLEEKSKQVQMMGEIYAKAYGTFIWLDEISRTSQLTETYHRCRIEASSRARELNEALNIDDLLKQCFENTATTKEKQDVHEFGNHGYWSRLWIIQEIFLSRRVSLILGKKLLPLNRVSYSALLWFLGSSGVIRNDGQQGEDHQKSRDKVPWTPGFFAQLALAFYGMQLETRLSLLELIEQYHDYQCEQPRDRIFGLQSIASEGPQITVDYEISPLDLLVQCLHSHVKDRKAPRFQDENIDLWKVRCLMDALQLPKNQPGLTNFLQNTTPSTRVLLTVPCFNLALYPNTLYTIPPMRIHASNSSSTPAFKPLITWEQSRWPSYHPEDYNTNHRILQELDDLTAPSSQTKYLKCCMPSADHEFILSTSDLDSTGNPATSTWSLSALSATNPRLIKGCDTTGTILRKPSLPKRTALCMDLQFRSHREYLSGLDSGNMEGVPVFHVACCIEDLLYLTINDR